MSLELIREHCKTLKLSTIASNISKIEFEDKEDYILKLLEKEILNRKNSKINMLIKQAGFPVLKTLENYDKSPVKLPNNLTWEKLLDVEFINTKENLILIGPVGTGKTHLAYGLGIQACKAGKNVKVYSAPMLVNTLISAYKDGYLSKIMKSIQKCELLIIDEIGYIPFHRDGAELLFQIISDAYEKRSLIITTNLEFGHWNTIFGDSKLTAALIDRIIHHANFIVFNGDSFRLKHTIEGMSK
jgi:DNA replication protein DnaC